MNITKLHNEFQRDSVKNVLIFDENEAKKSFKEWFFKNQGEDKEFINFLKNVFHYNELVNKDYNFYYELEFLNSTQRLVDNVENKDIDKINNLINLFVHYFDKNFSNKTFFQVAQDENLLGIDEQFIDEAREIGVEKKSNKLWFDSSLLHCLLCSSESESLRKKAYTALMNLNNDDKKTNNKSILSRIINLKQKIAKVRGYENYVDLVFSEYVFSKDEIFEFIKFKKEEVKEVKNLLENKIEEYCVKNHIHNYPWNHLYVKNKICEFDKLVVEKKLTVNKVFNNVKNFIANNFSCSIKSYKSDYGFFWDMTFVDGSRKKIFFDIYERENKYTNLLFSCDLDKNNQVISLNFNKEDKYLFWNEFIDFMHELGHSMQRIACPNNDKMSWDTIEIPSLFFERICYDYDFISKITGGAVKQADFDAFLAVVKFEKAILHFEQLCISEKTLKLFSQEKVNHIIINKHMNDLVEEHVFHNFFNDPFMGYSNYNADYGPTQYAYVLGSHMAEKINSEFKESNCKVDEIMAKYFNGGKRLKKLIGEHQKRKNKNG